MPRGAMQRMLRAVLRETKGEVIQARAEGIIVSGGLSVKEGREHTSTARTVHTRRTGALKCDIAPTLMSSIKLLWWVKGKVCARCRVVR
jgi:hypothetical protein